MKDEKTFLVTMDGDTTQEYGTAELVLLWRTAQIPDKAEYRDDRGGWRPLGELVEPIIAKENATTRNALRHERKPVAPQTPKKSRWPMVIAGAIGVIAILVWLVIELSTIEPSKVMKTHEVQTKVEIQGSSPPFVQHEKEIRSEELIKSHKIFPGMTEEQVREIWGEPKGVEWSSDPKLEMWRYKGCRVFFKDGTVSRLELIR